MEHLISVVDLQIISSLSIYRSILYGMLVRLKSESHAIASIGNLYLVYELSHVLCNVPWPTSLFGSFAMIWTDRWRTFQKHTWKPLNLRRYIKFVLNQIFVWLPLIWQNHSMTPLGYVCACWTMCLLHCNYAYIFFLGQWLGLLHRGLFKFLRKS